uniref:TMPIT-like protein n=1 Tax=Araucaria cunninghamii TaxID=56994 RepID=A0A0D6R1I6_ARACU
MTNGVQNDHESRDMESIAEEIGRLVDQAKALQDSASAFCSKIKLEEEGIRLKALALESDIKRLRSSLNSASDKDAIDHREAEKLEEELFRARCMISEGDVSALLPAKSQGSFLKMFLGPINVRAIRNDVRLKVKEEYNNYRDRTAILFLLFPCVLLLLKNWVWNGCFPGFPVQLYQAWLLFFYTSLALRENILRVNGSDIRPWWVYHHYCAMFMALVSLTWEIRGQPSCVEKQQGVRLFLTWAIMQGVAMLLQNRYQRQRLYTRIALGKGFEGYIGLLLLRTAIVGGNSEWQVVVCGILLLIMAVGNFANTVETLVTKSRVKARIKRSKSKQTMESMPLNFPSSRKEL